MDEKMKGIYEKLAAPFPEGAIQRTKGTETRKGYDTTGVSYQFVVNRLNEVAGLHGWNYTYEVTKSFEGTWRSDSQFYDLTLEVSMWVGDPNLVRKAPGGHRAATYADALKGALTNGLKKVAAMFGPGRQAYEGTLDDDNLPHPPLPNGGGRLKEIPAASSQEISQDGSSGGEELGARWWASVISEPQRKRIFALCRENKLPYEDLKLYLKETHKVEHSRDIRAGDYNIICQWIQNGGLSGEELHAAAMNEEIQVEGLSD